MSINSTLSKISFSASFMWIPLKRRLCNNALALPSILNSFQESERCVSIPVWYTGAKRIYIKVLDVLRCSDLKSKTLLFFNAVCVALFCASTVSLLLYLVLRVLWRSPVR